MAAPPEDVRPRNVRIHGFGPTGEMSPGARIALAPFIRSVNEQVPDENGNVTLEISGGGGGGSAALQEHIVSATPHPHYDDMQSLTLLFKNRLV